MMPKLRVLTSACPSHVPETIQMFPVHMWQACFLAFARTAPWYVNWLLAESSRSDLCDIKGWKSASLLAEMILSVMYCDPPPNNVSIDLCIATTGLQLTHRWDQTLMKMPTSLGKHRLLTWIKNAEYSYEHPVILGKSFSIKGWLS